MDFMDLIKSVETIAELDDRRQETFKREFEAFEEEETNNFEETREIIEMERTELANLEDLLETERKNLDELIEETEFLTVDQAVRHRDAAVEKLKSHNEHLEVFRKSMIRALDTMESNLNVIVEDEGSGNIENVEPYLEDAYQAIERQNEAVADLDRNFTIMSAYLP